MQKKSIKNSKPKTAGENAIWLFKELGIYNSAPEKDKKINEALKSFLKSFGSKPTRIKLLEKK